MTRRRWIALGAAWVVCAAGFGMLAARSDEIIPPAYAAPEVATAGLSVRPPALRVAEAPATTTTLPQPAEPPDDPYAPEPEVVLGTLTIPRLDLTETLHQGLSLVTIDRGPSHWPGSALPGHLGNVVVAGHRVTHSAPFRRIEELVPGDQVVFDVADGRFTYEVVGSEIVTPEGMHIVDQRPEHTATLFACHPPGSARFRYVVHLRLAGAPAA